MSSHPATAFPPVVVLVHDSDGEARRVFGPFVSDDAAREWAEQAFPKSVCTTQDLDAPFDPTA